MEEAPLKLRPLRLRQHIVTIVGLPARARLGYIARKLAPLGMANTEPLGKEADHNSLTARVERAIMDVNNSNAASERNGWIVSKL